MQEKPDSLFLGSGQSFVDASQEVVSPFHLDLLEAPCGVVAMFDFFAGFANLTRCMLLRGFDAFAFDFSRNKQQVRAPCACVDLSTESGQAFVLELYSQFFVLVTSLSPPCGTASKAREIPMEGKSFQPMPLRSSDFPLGLPIL